jgi:high-affinity iron transporter
MLATAIIVFREILEAALIIGIVAAATQGVLRRGMWIGAGVTAGLVGAVVVAGLADVIVGWADGMGQELFNACVLLAAVVMLAWHNIWMASHSRDLVAQMKQVGSAVKEGEPMFALVLVVALAVLREGSEIVLFLYGQSAQGVSKAMMLSGGSAGLAVGAAVGLAMYFGLLRIPAKYLFSVTGWMILLLAAGMASQAAKFLVQADMLPAWGSVWDTSAMLANDSLLGSLLHTLVGYEANPLGVQIAVYLLTIVVIGVAMKVVNQKNTITDNSAANSVVKVAAFVLALPLLLSVAQPAKAGPASKVYTPNIEYGETEIELLGGEYDDNSNSVDGERAWKIGVGRGMSQNWFSEVEFVWEKDTHEGTEYSTIELVNIFSLTERGEHFLDLGLFSELKFPDAHDEANKIELGPMLQKQIGAATYNLNLIWSRDYGHQADHVTEFEYAFQARVQGDPMLEFGLQAFGELGEWSDMNAGSDQEHKIGPAVFGTVKANRNNKVSYDGALLLGLTDDTPDTTVRFAIEYEMY